MYYIVEFFRIQLEFISGLESYAGGDWFGFLLVASLMLSVLMMVEGYIIFLILKWTAIAIGKAIQKAFSKGILKEYLESRIEKFNRAYEQADGLDYFDEEYTHAA